MSYTTFTYEKKDRVASIKIVAPITNTRQTAFSAAELSDICTDIQSDKDIRVVTLSGTDDRAFSSGEASGVEWAKSGLDVSVGAFSLTEPLMKLDQPLIAGIRGDAIGIGLELALVCDLRISTDTSLFGFPHIQHGLIPWDGGTQRLSRLVGKGKALEMILTGDRVDAQEACRIGLVNRIVPEPELDALVGEMGHEMATKGPISLAYSKEAINKGMDLSLEQGLRLEADLYFLIHTTKDRTEGIRAFQEKRPAQFEGR